MAGLIPLWDRIQLNPTCIHKISLILTLGLAWCNIKDQYPTHGWGLTNTYQLLLIQCIILPLASQTLVLQKLIYQQGVHQCNLHYLHIYTVQLHKKFYGLVLLGLLKRMKLIYHIVGKFGRGEVWRIDSLKNWQKEVQRIHRLANRLLLIWMVLVW